MARFTAERNKHAVQLLISPKRRPQWFKDLLEEYIWEGAPDGGRSTVLLVLQVLGRGQKTQKELGALAKQDDPEGQKGWTALDAFLDGWRRTLIKELDLSGELKVDLASLKKQLDAGEASGSIRVESSKLQGRFSTERDRLDEWLMVANSEYKTFLKELGLLNSEKKPVDAKKPEKEPKKPEKEPKKHAKKLKEAQELRQQVVDLTVSSSESDEEVDLKELKRTVKILVRREKERAGSSA